MKYYLIKTVKCDDQKHREIGEKVWDKIMYKLDQINDAFDAAARYNDGGNKCDCKVIVEEENEI